MGLFDSTDWSDPANAAQMAFAANLMSSGKGLFPAYGDALKAAPGAAANAQAYRSNQIGIADNIAKLQAWMGKTNHFRRQAGMPDLTLDDLVKGNYSLLPDAQKQGALAAATGGAQPASSPAASTTASPLAPATSPDSVFPAQAGSSLFGDAGASVLPALQTTESANNPNAVSPVGARGLMQVMPATAKNPGFGIKPSNGTPEDDKRVGDQYYQMLEKKYATQYGPQAATPYALVAYNWGPGNTDKWIKAGADPSKIPAETQGEIAKVALRMAQGGGATPASGPQNVDPALAAPAQLPAGGVPQGPQSAIPSDLGLYAPDEAIANAEKQMTTLTPQQAQAAGLPAGSFAQQDPFGKVDVNTFGAVSPEALKQQETLWGVKTGQETPNGAPSSDDQMIHYWAQAVAAGGPLPTLGMGPRAAILRQKILSEAASINSGQGLSGADQNARTANVKAGTQTLGKVTALRAASEAYENTMLQNMGIARDMLTKPGVGGQSPIINRWTRYIKGEYGGDPDVAAFNTALTTVKNEYAKIQSGSIGNTPVTDSARHEAEGMVNANMSPQQIIANFDYMVKEVGNRTRALRAQEDAIKSGISGKSDNPQVPGISEPQSSKPNSTHSNSPIKRGIWNPATGKVEWQ